MPDGYSMGTLLYSLPLAPGQKKQISIVDWESREFALRSESMTEIEQLEAGLIRDRDIEEIVKVNIPEQSEAYSRSSGGGLNLGIVSFGSSSSRSFQSSSRDLSSSALQSLRDRTNQSASALRGRRSTVVESVRQGERSVAQSESIANYNHCHAVTMQYFEVLRHLLIRQRLVEVQECLFIPLKISRFTPDKILQFREPLSRFLRDRSLRGGFNAIDRISNNYEGSDVPTGAYADEDIVHLSGHLTLRFQFVPPESEEFDESSWEWFRFYPIFGASARSIYNRLKAAAASAARSQAAAFHQQVAPKLAQTLANDLELTAITDGGGRISLRDHLDFTLTSDYRHDARLNVTVRMKDAPPSVSRSDIVAIEFNPVSSERLPQGSRILVEGGRLSYRTRYSSGYLFRDSRIRNDLTDTDGVYMSTPLSQAEQRRPREEDKELKRRLIEYCNDNTEYCHKVIWITMSPDRRYMMLDGFIAPNSGGRSVASVVDNIVVGVIGNSLVMPVARGLHLDPSFKENEDVSLLDHYRPTTPADPLRITLPTKGVYAEAVMGQCNSCEHKEEDRFWRWEESPIPDSPTPIQPLSTDTRRAEPPDLEAKDLSSPIINLQNAPAAPDPGGLAAAMQLLATPNLFKDITGLEGNQRNAIEALKIATEAAQQYGAEAADVAKSFGENASNLAMQSSTSQDMDRIQRSIQTARSSGLIDDAQASELTQSALRNMVGLGGSESGSSPRGTESVLNTIRSASEEGYRY